MAKSKKFVLKKKAFKNEDKYTFYNDKNELIFLCNTESNSLAKQIHIKDNNDEEVAFVSQGCNLLLPEFDITIKNKKHYMKREYLPVNPYYTFNQGEYNIEGTIGMHKYKIMNELGDKVGNFTKTWLKVNDIYDIELDESLDMLMAFTMVLAVDCVLTYEILTII